MPGVDLTLRPVGKEGRMTKDDFSKWLGAGLDDAIVGYAERCGAVPALVYDSEKLLQAFINQGMEREEALEWIEFNIANAYIGDDTPYLMYALDED